MKVYNSCILWKEKWIEIIKFYNALICVDIGINESYQEIPWKSALCMSMIWWVVVVLVVCGCDDNETKNKDCDPT